MPALLRSADNQSNQSPLLNLDCMGRHRFERVSSESLTELSASSLLVWQQSWQREVGTLGGALLEPPPKQMTSAQVVADFTQLAFWEILPMVPHGHQMFYSPARSSRHSKGDELPTD